MLSEFEVPKPNLEFNQIILEPDEVFIEGLRVTLHLTSDRSMPGILNLCSRSVIFQPKNEKLPLLKFKMCDNLHLKSGKFTPDYLLSEVGARYEEFLANVRRIFKIQDAFTRKEEMSNSGAGKGLSFFLRTKKVSIYERSPPAPFSVEMFTGYFLFKVETGNRPKLQSPSSHRDLEEMLYAHTQFEKMFERVQKCEDEEKLIEELVEERFGTYKAKQKARGPITLMYSCKIIETFEKFYGAIVLKESKKLIFKPLLNVTKDVKKSINLRDIKFMMLYEFYYKKTGIEFFTYDSAQSILIDFGNEKTAEKVYKYLKDNCNELIDIQLDVLTKTWTNNLMSNFDYLMHLNRFSNRSFNDIARYPIFPWVISDYFSDEFRPNSKNQYRDLTKPLHALAKARESKAKDNYVTSEKDPVPIRKPFHCSMFPSNPGAVVYFYTRSVPFLITKLQSEAFGPTDRIFKSFESLWSQMNTGHMNFIELIPEMYVVNKADVLKNKYGLEFGTGTDGEEISDVGHARWAANLQDFMFKVRAGLESEHCSLHLHEWIDNIFGVNQRGVNAKEKFNVYSEECYKENVNFNNVKSKMKVHALKMQVHQYGQVPAQLFEFGHPKKKIKAQFVEPGRKESEEANSYNNNYVVKLALPDAADSNLENKLPMGDQSSNFDMNMQDTKRYSTDLLDRLNALRKNLEPSQSHHFEANFDHVYDPDENEVASDLMFNSELDLNDD